MMDLGSISYPIEEGMWEAPAVLAADGPAHQDEPETHASLSVIRNPRTKREFPMWERTSGPRWPPVCSSGRRPEAGSHIQMSNLQRVALATLEPG